MSKKAPNRAATRKRPVPPMIATLSAVHVAVRELMVDLPAYVLLGELYRLRGLVNAGIDHAVSQAREDGYSWSQIGRQLRVSPQAVQQRHSLMSRINVS